MLLTPAAHAECKLTQYASADLELTPAGGLMVGARIGTRDVWMMLQMSGSLPVISPAAVAELGLKARPVQQDRRPLINGVRVQQEVRLDSLLIGGANFDDWTLYLPPNDPRPLIMHKGRPVVGTLSSRFINVVDMELDLASGKMNLFKHARCRGEQVYWSRDFTTETLYVDNSGLLFFAVELDDRRVETALNTLGPRSRLSERAARRYFGFERRANLAPAPNGQAMRPVGERRFGIAGRGLSLPDVPVLIIDDSQRNCEIGISEKGTNAAGFRGCVGIVPFEMGTDLLRRMRIYIASSEQRVYFTRSANVPAGAGDGANAGAAGQAGGDVPRPDSPAVPGAAAADAD